jgi:RNA polymerase sigma-70 factor (ECF subfamily)
VSVVAASHTQRISSTLFFRRASTVPASDVVVQGERPSATAEKTGSGLALVCAQGVAAMDVTEEVKPALEQGLERKQAGTQTFEPDEHAERLLHLFRSSDTGKEEEDIVPHQLSGDAHGQIFALYEEYCPRLFGYLRSLHMRQEEAEEVIQETFTLLTAALLQKTEIENVQGWIVRVSHHLAVDVIKQKERNANRIRDLSAFEFDSIRDRASSPEETLLKQEQTQRIETALSQFTPLQRQCFYMRAEGFRYKDIALALGISPQRVERVVKKVTVRLAAVCG